MDRRQSLKLIATGAIASGALVAGCATDDKKAKEPATPAPAKPEFSLDRSPEEMEYERALRAKGSFFSQHEMVTITILADIIIPRDEVSGSASEAGVPAFIDFIVQDMPQHQTPMRGGLRWMDTQSIKRFGKTFAECTPAERITLVDLIAYPERVKKDRILAPGVAFFSLMRNLTTTGFYTSETGIKDLGYAGNRPNQWNGVPADVLQQYDMSYTEKEIKECVQYTQNT